MFYYRYTHATHYRRIENKKYIYITKIYTVIFNLYLLINLSCKIINQLINDISYSLSDPGGQAKFKFVENEVDGGPGAAVVVEVDENNGKAKCD